MTTNQRTGAQLAYDIYPAFCNVDSPTFNKWVKLTAADVHGLRRDPAFESQGIYFHLNHPIRYVYLVGVIVSIDWFTERWVLLTLDDGSGAAIEVKLERVVPPKPKQTTTPTRHETASGQQATLAPFNNDDREEEDKSSASETDEASGSAMPNSKPKRSAWSPTPLFPATTLPNVKVTPTCPDPYCTDHRHLTLDGQPFGAGTLIKAKGSLSSFRGTMQLLLERAAPVLDADEEPRIWAEYARFVTAVLCKPWVLSQAQVRALDERVRSAARQDDEKRRAAEKRQAVRERKIRRMLESVAAHEVREEARRQAEREILDGNPLDRAGWRPWPEVVAERERGRQAVPVPERPRAQRDDDQLRHAALRRAAEMRYR